MTLSQSVASELLEAFRAGEGVDLVRESVRMVMQDLIEVDAAEQIGAGRYQRTDTRVTERNGSRPKVIATQAGDVELTIPKLRQGTHTGRGPEQAKLGTIADVLRLLRGQISCAERLALAHWTRRRDRRGA